MTRLCLPMGTTLFGVLALVVCLSGDAAAQIASSTVTSLSVTRVSPSVIDSLRQQQALRHKSWKEGEGFHQAQVLELKARIKKSKSSTAALQLFLDSDQLLAQRIKDLQRSLDRVSMLDPALIALAEKFKDQTEAKSQIEKLIDEDRSLRNQLLLGPYHDIHWIVDVRASLIKTLSDIDYDRVTSWSSKTKEGFKLELSAVQVMTEAHLYRLSHQLENFDQFMTVIGGVKTIGGLIFNAALVLFLFVWIRRQVPGVLEKLRVYEYQFARTVKQIRQVDRLVAFIDHFAILGFNIAAVHAFEFILKGRFNYIEIKVAFAVAYWVAYYRLAYKLVEVLIFRVARRRFRIDYRKRKLIAQSIFFFGRVVLTGGLLLSVISAVTNLGLLYYWARNLVFAAAIIAGLILLNRWRPSVVALYLEKNPSGKLSELIERNKDKPYGFFLVVFAFLSITTHGVLILLRDTILSFEQSRKALAYFFRRRLEKHAEELGQWDDDLSPLPEALTKAFTLEPLKGQSLRINRFEELDEFQANYDRWLNYKAKGAALVVSPKGFGKTTWLHRAVEDEGVEYLWLSMERLNARIPNLCSYFRELYEFNGDDLNDLTEAILQGPRCVVVLDDIHCLITRRIEGCKQIEALMDLIENTGHHVFWLCSMDSLSWKYLQSACPQRPWFRQIITISRWSDEEIAQLIMVRAAASGVVHSFEDLITEEMAEKSDRRLAEISQSYSRLIWDSSDGCPWVALHYWLRSLAPVSESAVRVRLFRRVDLTRLERWPKEAMFLYAAIALHSHLSASELASILRYSKEMCEGFLSQGCEEGYLVCDEDGRYHFNVNWYRPIMRYLTQRHAVEDV